MSIFRPELNYLGTQTHMPIKVTHEKHIVTRPADFQRLGAKITGVGDTIGADAVIRSGTFADSMLGALDKVSASQQFASQLNQAALLDPDSVNVEDVTIAQAEAMMSLNIARSVLNRVVQGWRDLINTR
jgi:flagellar hook-basal body complex protein FliE